jgi:CDGSH-type Zn-finger protein/uncharacterized Fe-S cluster protein YjdI
MSAVKSYPGRGITVHYEVARCIHAAECVRGLPAVFDPQARPWIQPEKADADGVAEVVARCPTGALHAVRDDGRAAEPVPARNEVRLVADGPLHLRGDVELRDERRGALGTDTRVALCRCGASKNKPYCDNSHAGAGFADAGGCAPGETKPLAAGRLVVTATADGPLRLDGPLAVVDAFGDTAATGEQTWLCRCGHSANKPFCDGSHKRVGFTA